MRFSAAFKHDVRFQFRNGFYYVYLLVSLVYIVILKYFLRDYQQVSATLVIFSDPGILGFFFIGAIVLLEKGLNILESLFVTPLRVHEYFLAKVGSLTLVALTSSLAIIVAVFGFKFNPVPLCLGVILSSIFCTLLGFTLAARVPSVNGFLMSSPVYLLVFMLPIVEYLGIVNSPLFYLHPAKAVLLLLDGAFNGVSLLEVSYAVVTLLVWCGVMYWWALRWFNRYVILKIGGGGR